MSNSEQVLSSNLFLLNPNIQKSLLRVREICNEISQLRLHKIEQKTYTIEEFIAAQVEHKEYMQERLEFYFNELKTEVLHACEVSLEVNGFMIDKAYPLEDETDFTEDPTPRYNTGNYYFYLLHFWQLPKDFVGAAV